MSTHAGHDYAELLLGWSRSMPERSPGEDSPVQAGGGERAEVHAREPERLETCEARGAVCGLDRGAERSPALHNGHGDSREGRGGGDLSGKSDHGDAHRGDV